MEVNKKLKRLAGILRYLPLAIWYIIKKSNYLQRELKKFDKRRA